MSIIFVFRYRAFLYRTENQAKSGDPDAQRKLGLMFLQGTEEISGDKELGYNWYKKAADQGDPVAKSVISYLDSLRVTGKF